MTLSIWRYAHLALAIMSSLFLLILSVTGVILAIDAVNEKVPAYRVKNFESLNVAQSVSALRKVYPEIIEVSVDHNQFVSVDALDEEGNTVKAYIDPLSGQILGSFKTKSQFIQWVTALHRSLFLKETGRIIVGVVSFLLLLITFTGTILILKRQQGIRHFFAKIQKDFFSQYFHVISGRLLLIPVFIISLTGTYLFLVNVNLLGKEGRQTVSKNKYNDKSGQKVEDFEIFKQTKLSKVEKIEFPFDSEDPEEVYVLKLRDRMLSVNQTDGSIQEETKYPSTVILEKLSLDLHTGRTNVLWAIILGIASLNIVFFMYTGFVITFKRSRTRVKNKYKADEAEIVILFGSENGSTLFFANQIHKQLLADGKTSFLAEMNQYQRYSKARHILVFASTYGLGDAPSNAGNFERLIEKYPQDHTVRFSVIGFGSTSYPDFCSYAVYTDQLLDKQSWASRFLPLHTVNDKSLEEFVSWVHHWSEKSLMALATAPAVYSFKAEGLRQLQVVERTQLSGDNTTFKILLKPSSKIKFKSGDLLAIYPANNNRERFYSIGESNGLIQLVVKLYPNGFGSGFLYQLEKGQCIQARVMFNPHFHFPEKAPAIAMIANGTGIAPFLGMILSNSRKKPVHLYAGFRYDNELTQDYRRFAEKSISQQQLKSFKLAFSREEQRQYVMDLIQQDAGFFLDLLRKEGVIMICGSLNMQKDVERVLEQLSLEQNDRPLSYYKDRNQILTDCY
ncbi:flavodoxin/nitric oxide synthase [Pseudopedobacter saltans DSM 12145]|uniref:Flavodoxin/nitric oxide synthase n=1 Tax=Pseudopedobacter saltans (strain ATCC 51119 / DSM 12145 / JCM 21818 / CCUG 39354 / LMG 10337 / NBRC 100064 / NCIMB 13643) TaxID=762903 RepID=F0SCT4_PSESL|nr:PepSY domain-containing protein [Pseudopedobacter saltans]ADY50673.1 flavodoxin/nitric oxide synthase [Pseudopedobacter saltans DSM 12145]